MNYIKCFNRSRAANCLQPVFVSGASMLARMEYYAPVPFAPVLVPRCWHGWSITPVCHLRPSWCLDAGTDGVLQPVPLCAVPGASMLPGVECCSRCPFAPFLVPFWCPTPSYYIHYGISQILGTLHRSTLLAARYRLYRASRRLGNCEQI